MVEISSPLTRSEHAYSNNSPCADTSGRTATGWCVQFPGPYAGRSGHPTGFTLDLCRLPAVPAATASFPSTAEASFQLSNNNNPPRQLWSLARQHPGHPDRHDVAVGSGRCLSWHLTWQNRDDHGAPIPAGDYTLAVSVDADNVADPNQISTQVYRYTVSSSDAAATWHRTDGSHDASCCREGTSGADRLLRDVPWRLHSQRLAPHPPEAALWPLLARPGRG